MEDDRRVSPETGAGTLMKGILHDAEHLFEQQVLLLRSEVKQELRQLKSGLVSVAIGAGIAAVGVVFLIGMIVHVLAAKTQIPLWGCYGIVGGALALLGIVFLLGGRKSVSDVHLAPPPETARAFKENVAWLKNIGHRKTAEPTT